jgi:hypothetical protein
MNFISIPGFELDSVSAYHFKLPPLSSIQIPITHLSFYAKTLPTFYNSKYTPRNFQNPNLVPKTSNIHTFSTVTPNQVILVPNFS